MTCIVAVEKDGIACIAADTLTSYGTQLERAHYLCEPEKILHVGDAYLGFAGWAVSRLAVASALRGGFEFPEVRDEIELFDVARRLHATLKEDYFLSVEGSWAFEKSPMTILLANRFGIFGLDSDRAVMRYRRFTAIGSGAPYALGAMHARYEGPELAEDVALAGVEAAVEFDDGCLGPITMKRVKLA